MHIALHHSALCNTLSSTVATFPFVVIKSFSPLLTNCSIPLIFRSPLTNSPIWLGTRGAWKKNTGEGMTVEVRLYQRCWLHILQGLHGLVIILCVCHIN
jgi:hypothetical protein